MVRRRCNSGFSLIEMLVVIMVIGILTAVAMQSMKSTIDDVRRVATEREMQRIACAVTGNPAVTSGGVRSDFGYVGDVGSFPPSLDALRSNPGGLATWHGPYLQGEFVEDTIGYKTDQWGEPYVFNGTRISSGGHGSPITKTIAGAALDYLANTYTAVIRDAADSAPGDVYRDSVIIVLTAPDGAGGMTTRNTVPDSSGSFTLTALPVGPHSLEVVYIPDADTLQRYVTILPRHRSSPPDQYRFASAYFSGGAGCNDDTLLPQADVAPVELAGQGCSGNWQCVNDYTPDDDNSYVETTGDNWESGRYETADPASSSCSIISVTVFIRVRRFVKEASAKVILATHGADFEGPDETLTDDYENYSVRYTVNPSTGAPWTQAELQDLRIGVSLRTTKSTHPARCTRVWAIVEYGG
jgi:prepilin-type N-terminal cleavage/methylation domain-containing protein